MLDYDFMRAAFLAGGIVAVVAGAVGYFLVLRNLAFAGHALSHVGFAGATGAVLIGAAPLWGLVVFTLAAGTAMGMLGDRLRGRDVAVGIILSVALGFGVLFLHFYTSYATQATSLLFGNVLGVSMSGVANLLILAVASLTGLAIISRPLLFATIDPEMAEARGVSLRLVSVLFMIVVALAVAEATQIVGILLVFALMVGPAAAALRLSSRFRTGLALSVLFALAQTWAGIALAFVTDWPPSFWITFLSFLTYGASIAVARSWRPRKNRSGSLTPENGTGQPMLRRSSFDKSGGPLR
jgi:zinc/manganese transport system permease protein